MRPKKDTRVYNTDLTSNISKYFTRKGMQLRISINRLLGKNECSFTWPLNCLEENRQWLDNNGYSTKVIFYNNGWNMHFYWKVSW